MKGMGGGSVFNDDRDWFSRGHEIKYSNSEMRKRRARSSMPLTPVTIETNNHILSSSESSPVFVMNE